MAINLARPAQSPDTKAAFETYLEAGMTAIEKRMHDVCESDVTVLRDASHHILSAGGKRVRPRLLLLSYLACGGTDYNAVTSVASALELVHTASVVHDDINDHGSVRRGKPSVNALWGRTFALLTGDFLFTKVYELMGPYKDLNIVLAEATVALVEGETLQAQAVKENRFTREAYMEIIARKTAALFKAGGLLGAEAANASTQVTTALGNFGFNVGLAFQIVDDILDLTADEAQLGKTAGIDLEQGRGIASVQDDDTTSTDAGQDLMDSIKRRAFSGDSIEKGRMQARMLVAAAISELEVLPDSAAKQGLIELAELIVNRDH